MRRLLILVAALALLTTACKIEINAELIINTDKTGEVVFEIGFDDEVAEFAASQGATPESMLEDFDLESMPGAVTTTERRGDMTFTIINVPVDDFTEPGGLGGGELTEGLTDDFEITFTEDRVTVSGSTTLDDALGGGGEDLAGIPPGMLADIFSINIRVTMPGKILDHNATSQSGNTLTWTVDLASGTFDVFAESNPNESAGGGGFLLYLLIGAAVVLAALLLWMGMRRRGSAPAAAASAPPAPPAPPAEDAPPPAPPPAE